MFITLDPSSTVVGYSIWYEHDEQYVPIECGLITPFKSRLDSLERVRQLAHQVGRLIEEYEDELDFVVIEVPFSRQHSPARRHTSLPVWAFAAGTIYGLLLAKGIEVKEVDNQKWTKKISKEKRKEKAKLLFKNIYTPTQDKGGDAADALLIGLWILEQEYQSAQ